MGKVRPREGNSLVQSTLRRLKVVEGVEAVGPLPVLQNAFSALFKSPAVLHLVGWLRSKKGEPGVMAQG